MAASIGLETAGHGEEAPGIGAGIRESIRAVEVGIGERSLRRGEAQMAAAPASADRYENDDGGNKEWKTFACPHDFYLARIERIMASKCVPESWRTAPGIEGVTPKEPASCVKQAAGPLLRCLLIEDFCVFGLCRQM